MGNITGQDELFQEFAKGLGSFTPIVSELTGTTTSAGAGSGHFSGGMSPNDIGTTLPGTLANFTTNPSNIIKRMVHMQIASAASSFDKAYLCIFYKFGTLSPTATGDRFTHDGATFPVTRTMFGQATQPLSLIPMMQVTTAFTTTPAVFTIKNGAGTTGYVNQLGNTVVGTKTMTMPGASVANNTTYVFRLEDGDSGVRDIQQINVGTASSAGAAAIWGCEIIAPVGLPALTLGLSYDAAFAGLNLQDIKPAVATSGTATTYFGFLIHANGSRSYRGVILATGDA